MAIKDQTIIKDLELAIHGVGAANTELLQRSLDEIKRLRKLAGLVTDVIDFNEVRKIARPPEPWADDNMRFERTDQ